MKSEILEFGPYTVKIDYDLVTNEINIDILDELGEVIEGINIKDDDEEESEDDNEETDNDSDRDGNYCLRCLSQAYMNILGDDDDSPRLNAFDLVFPYFTQTFSTMGDRTRSTITESFMGLAEPFLSGLLYRHFSGVTNIYPELTYEEQKIIVLDFPVKEYLEAGIIGQCVFKLLFQQVIERRDVNKFPIPVFLWADEAQYFVNPYDQIFLTTARGSRAVTVFLSQNISTIYRL